MKKVLFVFGTRPEAIKMAPLVYTFLKDDAFEVRLCVSAQHRQMLDQTLEFFSLTPDYDLDIMQANQDLFDITSRILLGLREILREYKPDMIFVHGDTTTALSASLAGFYERIPIAHIEAGLRTRHLYSPFPEEANRQMIDVLAQYYFAPTKTSADNLSLEGKNQANISISGNTVIDALFLALELIEKNPNLKAKIKQDLSLHYPLNDKRKFILVTGHRRENFGEGFVNICKAIRQIASENPKIDIVYPVHLNPNVQGVVKSSLAGVSNIFLIPPLNYEHFVYLMSCSHLIMTDSGGIQEEAPSLGKPVLLMRDNTERPEALEAGVVKLVGTNVERIVRETQSLLDNPAHYEAMSKAINPYGDSKSCQKILNFIKQRNQR
ncbi:UDP-N-acetylglucosamine 2-epimerase (non-hydrolyzing) [Helicobacter sp. MIT 05-5294]|uniref:non-hydrolyzing UDP-N-acetylglucosamine 2-epimerase n=1 Tax=Helicobacter sp. MIT 05-5294 TaxID=1548150 RepID=UPI00051FE22E|nr:UDP-N-acetylglucosamine 2-epimerase (non-hydrolyzing) [Helicobacter sp. MIT 05-5294]TLD85845.1 UDP-N-acetylglucosamine 2-epimerase (non-hydrolyzing) [Helicobacter sp. MIT 05-5294]